MDRWTSTRCWPPNANGNEPDPDATARDWPVAVTTHRYAPTMDALIDELPSTFDPEAPLPGPPEPWASTSMPEVRTGPPFLMTQAIAAEPALAARIVGRLGRGSAAEELARQIRGAATRGEMVVVTGCGTSEHAAQGVTEILRDAWRRADLAGGGPTSVTSAQAFELSLDPPSSGLVIGISHEGGTAATNAALAAARSAGARTALITVSDRSPGAAVAQTVVTTEELDLDWCHTIGYLSPHVAAAAVGALLAREPLSPDAVKDRLADGIVAASRTATEIARALADVDHILVIASGADRSAGRELVLKLEEGTWIPSAYRDLETFLHGHLPATGERTGLVLILADPSGRETRVERARQALAAAAGTGITSAAICTVDVAAALPMALTPAGRIVIPEPPGDLPRPVGALLGTATALQLLTERLARARGTNPDLIRRDDPRYRDAAAAAE
jgi:fructoselysine-6-P-deglycase FrlB-like protein